jgi:chromosomal replication initiation ATPase DnaA
MSDFEWQAGLKAVAASHGCTLEQLRGKAKFRRFVAARRDCYAYLRSRGWTLHQIARQFNRDHTSILWLLHPDEKLAAKQARQRRYVAERKYGAMA